MGALNNLANLNIAYIIIGFFAILAGLKYAVDIIGYFFRLFGLEFKWMRSKNENSATIADTKDRVNTLESLREEDAKNSVKYDQLIRDDVEKISDVLDKISTKLDEIDRRGNASEIAVRETLADSIGRKYRYYIANGGIPEDDVDEFVNMHDAYKGVGGNHSGDAKFEYCMKNLPILPVEVKLKFHTVHKRAVE